MLTVRNISTVHGKIQALWDVSIEVEEGEIVALVGANGAGKTTLLDTISGTYAPVAGSVEFQGQRIDGKSAAYIVEQGIAHVPQGGRLFSDMTVRENLEMGAYSRHAWKQRTETIEHVCQIFPRLKERETQITSTLSGGEKQMVAIGRGLMSRPKLCIFDEPSYGLSPKAVMEIFQVIKSLPKQGITVLLVEQNVGQALEMANRAYVLENGRITLQGIACDLLVNDYVRKAYLGL
jgi:branched-chain amino acid transport system ATP-binding protein